MEQIDNIGFGGLKLIQDKEQFCYGVDAVILADFANSLYPEFAHAVDLGTGNGIIPFILSYKNPDAVITGIEVQTAAVEMARRSCMMNGLSERIDFIEADVKDICSGSAASQEFLSENDMMPGSIDMVTCNPPYFIKGGAIPNSSSARFIARHETTAVLEDFVKAAAVLLKRQGHLFMVHRPSRLVDIFYYCRKHGLEPKDMRMVVPGNGEAANIVLIHCTKGGGKELRIMKELAVYGEDGDYSEEIHRIYERC